MKKAVMLGMLTVGVVMLSSSQAWAGQRSYYHNDDYRVFRKIVHVLDDIVNDDYRHRKVVVHRQHYPRVHKSCYSWRGGRICNVRGHAHYNGHGRNYSKHHYGYNKHYKKYNKHYKKYSKHHRRQGRHNGKVCHLSH